MIFSHLKNNPSNLPWLITQGLKLHGVKEVVGPTHNPVILQWAKDVGLSSVYKQDEIPWCGLFIAKVCQLAKKDIVKNPLWARNWAKWGTGVNEAGLGDILVFSRGSGGHVGFYIAEDASCYHVLGGNQGNEVSITRIKKARCIAKRRAKYNNQPLSVKPYWVDRGGKISTNEA